MRGGPVLPIGPGDRDQMASFLAAGYQLASSSTDFFDDDNGNLHEDAINALAAHRGSPKGVQRGATAPAPVWARPDGELPGESRRAHCVEAARAQDRLAALPC